MGEGLAMNGVTKVLAVVEQLNICDGMICDDCPLKDKCYGRDGKTVGRLAVEWLVENGYMKLPKAPRSGMRITVTLNGQPLMSCMSLHEVQKQIGYSHYTVRRYAKLGKRTNDGFGFEEVRDEN